MKWKFEDIINETRILEFLHNTGQWYDIDFGIKTTWSRQYENNVKMIPEISFAIQKRVGCTKVASKYLLIL